jgi:molybdopterin synthase catalytic subunit
MQVDVLLFAGAAETAGQRRISLEVAQVATLSDVADALRAAHPQLSTLLPSGRWAVDQQFAPLSTRVDGSQEIAFIPPVSGG